MARRRLGTKLLGVTLGLLAFLTAGSLLTVRRQFGQQLRHQAVREIRAGSRVLGSIIERSGAQLLDRGRVFAELPSLQAALTKNPSRLEPLLLEVKAVRAANLLWATDAQGKVLASTGEYPALGENLSSQLLLSAALTGQETLGFDLFGGEWWLVLSLPVKEKESSRLLGTVNLALLIGEAYLSRLSELIGTEVGFVWGEHETWSQGWPEGIRSQIRGHLTEGLRDSPRSISDFQEGRFLWLARPVTGGEPPIATGPIALLGIRLDESVIRRSSRAIGWIAVLTMAAGAFLSTWAIRPLTRELEETQAHLLQAEKMASVGQLAAGVAHELNSPLTVIMGNTQLALRMLTRAKGPPAPQQAELVELLKALDQESHRSRTIVGNLLDYSRVRPPTRVLTDIHALLDDSLKLVEHQASLQSVRIARQYQEGLPPLRLDPGQIKQVFLNVILNAVQAMPQGGTLTLKTEATPTRAKIQIQDTGVGIPPEQLPKVFEPFFTTKEVGSGTGLGLFISYGIIQRHQGTIELTSQMGRGTTTTIQLPL